MSVNTPATAPPPFIVTKQHRLFAEFADTVSREHFIGLCYGPPGVGKTLSARHYSRWDVIRDYLTYFNFSEKDPPPPEALSSRTILYTPKVHNTPRAVEKDLDTYHHRLNWSIQRGLDPESESDARRFLIDSEGNAELLIIDEADRLKTASLEQVRDHSDRTGIGVILIGMPGIEKRLARYPQLYSRVGFVHHYRELSLAEQTFVLARYWPHLCLDEPSSGEDYTTTEAVAAISRVTGGNFRLTSRLITQIERIMQINQLGTVTSEVVEAARESLVIGS